MKFLPIIMLLAVNIYASTLSSIEKDKDPLSITLKQNSKKFSSCFAQHILKNNLSSKGQITFNFQIDDKSNLLNLNIIQARTTFKSKKFQECMIKAMTNIHFPPAEVGKKSEITYPFTFRSQ